VSSKRKHALIAVAAGLLVVGAATAIGATELHVSKSVTSSQSITPTGAGGLGGPPGLGRPGPGVGGGRFGGGFRGGGFFGGLSVAATYLGVSQATLQADLAGGKTLAQVAKGQGKTANELVSAMVAATRKQLDTQVLAGRFTEQQEATIVASIEQRYRDLVDATMSGPGGFGRGFGGDGGGFGGSSGSGGFGGGQGQGGGQGSLGNGTVPA
jgi:D-Tyr-tRNA(Tyr) deacylase